MKRMLTKLFGRSSAHRQNRNMALPVRLRLQRLEERVVMDWGGSGGVGPPPMNQVILHGTESVDVVNIELVNGQYRVTGLDGSIDYGGGNYVPQFRTYPATIARFIFYGNGGSDGFQNFTGVATTVYGGPGHDWLVGGTGSDTFYGEDGDDRLEGRGGADTLVGGANNDSLEGGSGNDSLVGGAGNDTYIYKGFGLGADTITEAAFAGSDTLDLTQLPNRGVTIDLADASAQTVWSYLGSELTLTFSSNAGLENVWGTEFADTLRGNGRNNVITGGGGADKLIAGNGADQLFGGAGNDTLYSGTGSTTVADVLNGGDNDDTLISIGGSPTDVLTGGPGLDSYWLDTADTLSDPSSAELDRRHVHAVDQFLSYTFGFDPTATPVGKERNGEDLADPHTSWATDTEDFQDKPLFASGGPSKHDVFDNSGYNGFLLSRLSAYADANPDAIRQMVVDLGDGTYAVRFYRAGQPGYVRVDADLYVDFPGQPSFTKLGQQNSIWVPVVQKAYAFWATRGTYSDLPYVDSQLTPEMVAEHLGATETVWAGFQPDVSVGPADVLDWILNDRPTDARKDKITAGAIHLLTWIRDELAACKAVTSKWLATATVTNSDLVDYVYYNGSVYPNAMVEEVLTHADGTPRGIRLRHVHGETYESTDLAHIYLIIGLGTRPRSAVV